MNKSLRERVQLPIVIFTTVLTFSALYAPQPLLPLFVRELGIDLSSASLLTTVVFIPLSLAPLVYGVLLGSVTPKHMLQIAVLLLGLAQIPFLVSSSFPLLLGARLAQGILVPAILTALMTYTAQTSAAGKLQRSMSIYIAATIFGGFAGRAVSGTLASWFGWRSTFLVLTVSLLIAFWVLRYLRQEGELKLLKPQPRMLFDLLKLRHLRTLYLTVFCLFLVFAGMMNFLPFRLAELNHQASEMGTGLLYTGYLCGILTALGSSRIVAFCRNDLRAIRLGMVVFCLALVGFTFCGEIGLYLLMFLFCAAMFLVHATCSGLLNRVGGEQKGIVNGLYVAFYYAGGMVGSYVPGLAYRQWGWMALIGVLGAVLLWSLWLLFRIAADDERLTTSIAE